jgi:alkyl hydroperoxide reductase subunit AhpC
MTKLGYMAKTKGEFDRRNVKIIGLSVDSTGDHKAWAKDIEETQGNAPKCPVIGGSDFKVIAGRCFRRCAKANSGRLRAVFMSSIRSRRLN